MIPESETTLQNDERQSEPAATVQSGGRQIWSFKSKIYMQENVHVKVMSSDTKNPHPHFQKNENESYKSHEGENIFC